MFTRSLTHDLSLELRLKKEQFHLVRASARTGPTEEVQDFLVPEEHMALLIHEGIPTRLYAPGRYLLPSDHGKVKVRMIHQSVIRERIRGDLGSRILEERLKLIHQLPYERALLCVDGVLMATVMPGVSHATFAPPRPVAMPIRRVKPAKTLGLCDTQDLTQEFLFV